MAGLNSREVAMGKEKKSPAKLKEMRIAPAANGGQTAYHHFENEYGPGGDHPPVGPHIFPAHTEKATVVEGSLLHHVAKHLGIPHEVAGKEPVPVEHDSTEEDEMEE
jgi:hypothetical protein